MWPALVILVVSWCVTSRRVMRNPWPETLVAAAMLAGALVALARFFPSGVWQAALLAYMMGPWLAAPVMAWRTQRMADGVPELYDPELHAVPPHLREAVEARAGALQAAGLVRTADIWFPERTGTTAIGVLLESPDGHEGVTVAGYEAVTGEGTAEAVRLTDVSCTCVVRLADGRRLVVADSERESRRGIRGTLLERLPSLTDPVRLLAFARAYRARFLGGAPTEPLRGGMEPLEFVRARQRENMEALVRAGRARPLPGGGYGHTLRETFLLSLLILPPVRQIVGLWIRLRERWLLRQLGMTLPRASAGGQRWWFRDTDVQGAAMVAVIAVLLLPVPPLPSIPLPLPASGVESASALRPERPYRLPDGFTVPADFPGAVRALERLAGVPAVPLEVEDAYTGEPRRADGVEVTVAADQADAFLQVAAPLFRARGFLLFRHENTFGIGGAPEYIGLYPRADVFEVMRVVGTNGSNYGIGPDSVAAWFTRLQARHPFLVTGIAHDALEGRFVTLPDDAQARALAEEFHAFCPDVVTQGVRSVRALAAEIRRGGVYCWWD